ITFTSTPPSPAAIGGTYTVVATGGGSGNPVTFSVGAGTTNAACTVAGSTVTFAHAGTCVVAADQAGDADFAAAAQKTQSITVAKTAQTITITSTPPSPAAIGGTYPVTTTGGASGNPVVLSIDPATTNSACTLSGTTVTFAHAGTCVVAADQAGNADFDPAPQKTQTIAVAKTAQAITFTTAPPSPAFVGTTYVVGATGGGSGNPVTFSTSSPSCSLAGTTVTFLAAGPCDIDADQAGGPDFDAAPTATQIVAVTKVTSTVAVDIAPGATVHGQPATATATVTPALGSASGSVQFSVDGTDLGAPVAVSGGTAATALPADLGAGSHTIGAAFAPTDSTTFATATGSDTLAVGKAATAVLPSVSPHSIKATVTATPPGAGTPTGTVRFLVDGNPVGTGTLDAAGSATLAFTVPAGKTASVAAAYDGDADFLPSSASTARKDPTISASVSGKPKKTKAGWYRGTVTVSFSCAPNGAPLTSPCPSPVVLKRGGAGQSVSQTVTAADGGIGTASVGGINIDHRKPKVQIIGVKASGRYPSAPKARCKGTDKLSGIASCRIRQHKLSGNRVRYTAVATDKAGNRARRSVTVALAVSHVSILGLAAHGGAYDVTLGGSYTLVVIGGPRPRYVDAAVAPQQPSGLDAYFHQDGTVRGQPRWVLGVTITTDMGHSTLWNLGVLQGGRLHVVKVRVH
ncbi:Ig-like domain-containing protein, partial [Nocardioides halotolerans]|uniref:Ig-like domain-containing protein n=1 Tax=Nocardioides halotolerans TaxID=433660 RepID=UPI00055C491C